ncbi:MAG TPA: hypothetical protein VJT49_15265 [Amycolatopsis sp.]|uniref:hypothetical protein n=1 Tax=Amycolatopsis sp. TaxID=37632 RepID=UPI002B48657F|nr:hypothetical protein [Amycolatopsis sp.]HKS46438.1 hypothetical protein [Amycolatopsis sp.]
MAAELRNEQLYDELVGALDGVDQARELDSLQAVVVMSYLGDRGFDVDTVELNDRPRTIEGWVQWADRHSSAS